MENEKSHKLIIHSYQKLWKWNMRIYALSKDLPLPRALPIKLALYLCVGAIIAFLLFKLPVLRALPFAFKAAAAVGIAKFLESVKLDGKNPIVFFFGCIRFWLLERGMSLEHFKRYETRQKSCRFAWSIGCRQQRAEHISTRKIKLKWSSGTKGGNSFV